jgi:hypothetical protein
VKTACINYWDGHLDACVRWRNDTSQFFTVSNVADKRSVCFARCIRDLLTELMHSGTGCNVGGVIVNILVYANDIMGIATSA